MMKQFWDKKYLGAAFLVAFGVVFLLDNLFGFDSNVAFVFLVKFWPLALIIPGVMVFVKASEENNDPKALETKKEDKSEFQKDSD